MSHEIRTPLTTIIGYANLLAENPELDGEDADFALRIKRSAGNLLNLVNDVLDVSKFQSGQVRLSPRLTNLRSLATGIVQQFECIAQQKGLSLWTDFDDALPDLVMIDDFRLTQVLNNLIGNACKFTDAGHVSVSFLWTTTGVDGQLRVEIADTGCGVDPHQIPQLFDRFTQADGTTTRRHGGTGLGLSICREIILMFDGEIGVESQTSLGSRFWFTVPVNVSSPTPSQAPKF